MKLLREGILKKRRELQTGLGEHSEVNTGIVPDFIVTLTHEINLNSISQTKRL